MMQTLLLQLFCHLCCHHQKSEVEVPPVFFFFSIAATLRVQSARWMWLSSPVPPCCPRVWCVLDCRWPRIYSGCKTHCVHPSLKARWENIQKSRQNWITSLSSTGWNVQQFEAPPVGTKPWTSHHQLPWGVRQGKRKQSLILPRKDPPKRAIISLTNSGIVSKAALEKLQRGRIKHIWAFLTAYPPS